MRKLYWSMTLLVLAHAVVVFWHLELLARRDAALNVDQIPLFAGLANIIPTFAFRISAVLLFVLEFLGCCLSIQILRASSLSVASA
jgi:hypothetical protein